MPRLPDATDLGARPIPQSRARFVPDAAPGEAVASGLASVAAAGFQVREREDKLAYAKAKSDLLIEDAKARAELEKDNDWETYEPRYRERMKKAREAVTKTIRSPSDRAFFEQDVGFDIERGALAVQDFAKRKEGDAGRATLDGLLEANRTAALEAKDEGTRVAFVKSAHDAIQGAVDKGYISRQDAVNYRQRWTASYSEGYVGTLPAEDRIKMLSAPKGTAAEFIAPDRRAALLKVAQNENRELTLRRDSQAAEDRIFAEGGSLESMRAKARKLDNPEVRDSAIARLEARYADRFADQELRDRDLRRSAWDVVLKGGKWDDIPARVTANMDPQDGIQIKNYLAAGAAGPAKTDLSVWYDLKRAQGDNPKAFAEADLLKYRGSLSESDFQALAESQSKIKDDIAYGYGVQSDNSMVDSALRGMGIKTTQAASKKDIERAADFRYQFDREITALQKETGKKASEDQKRAVVDRLTLEVVTKRGFFSDTHKRVFEVQPNENIEEVVIPKDERKVIIAKLKQRGIEPTEERIQSLYMRARQ